MRFTIVLLILALARCSCDRNTDNKRIPVIPSSLDSLFDIETSIVQSKDESGNLSIDTIRREIQKVRKIFRKGICYTYLANYYDYKGAKICSEEVKLIPTGRRINIDPEMQDLVLIEYNIKDADKQFILENHERINKSYPLESNWVYKSGEGVIENSEKVWMHPIRNNQYIFTQINGFPTAQLPLEVGKKWNSQLSINYGWGDWDGLELESEYKVTGTEILDLKIGSMPCWIINVETASDLGLAKAKFNFNDSLGFLKMDYSNFKGEHLVFEMIKIEDGL